MSLAERRQGTGIAARDAGGERGVVRLQAVGEFGHQRRSSAYILANRTKSSRSSSWLMRTHGREGHDHDHDHRAAAGGSGTRRALWIALALTAGFSLVEAVGGWFSGSLALLSDAGHMVTDAAALGLAIFADAVAHRPPSQQSHLRPYSGNIRAWPSGGSITITLRRAHMLGFIGVVLVLHIAILHLTGSVGGH
jgi:hypothetical protein